MNKINFSDLDAAERLAVGRGETPGAAAAHHQDQVEAAELQTWLVGNARGLRPITSTGLMAWALVALRSQADQLLASASALPAGGEPETWRDGAAELMLADDHRAHVAQLQALSVTNIMIDIVPGADGMGEEVYAKSTDDVVKVLSKQGDRIEELETERDALKAEVVGLEEAFRIKTSYYDQECEAHKRTQSELTKARELLSKLERTGLRTKAQGDEVRGFLAHQSAPGEKGGSANLSAMAEALIDEEIRKNGLPS